jgi:epoxyqueuosine reductase
VPLTSTTVKELARASGFDLAGVSAIGEFRELDVFPDWIAEGRAGDMRYLETRNDAGELKRAALKNAAPWARSVVVCAINYNSATPYSTEVTDPERGWISRYAWSQRDYHDVILEKLRRLESQIGELAGRGQQEFRSWCYVDTGPLVERVYAKYAGIGWIAKNTCIINQQLGSWLFLGVILTSLPLTPDLPAPDRCGTCTRCIDACPTHAFPAPYQLDPTRCISYLTIEKRGPIPEDLRDGIGNNIFGCDICQDVCPWNNKDTVVREGHGFIRAESAPEYSGASDPEVRLRPISTDHDLAPRPELIHPSLDWLAAMDADEFRTVFRGSPIKRAKLSGVRRNVVTAMGNSGRLEFIPRLEELTRDEDTTVAEHARWALRQLELKKNQ